MQIPQTLIHSFSPSLLAAPRTLPHSNPFLFFFPSRRPMHTTAPRSQCTITPPPPRPSLSSQASNREVPPHNHLFHLWWLLAVGSVTTDCRLFTTTSLCLLCLLSSSIPMDSTLRCLLVFTTHLLATVFHTVIPLSLKIFPLSPSPQPTSHPPPPP